MRKPEDELAELEGLSLRRRLYELESAQAAEVRLDGEEMVNFSSNDYLGLSNHPAIIDAFCEGVRKWGAGSGSSRLISGSLSPHMDLEKYIAELKGKQSARVFANGYASAVGILSGLFTKGDVIILDKLSHASLIDGARLSGATIRVFPHNNLEKLESLLEKYQGIEGRVVVVTETVFSMDGDIAPLEEIIELKNKYGALLLIDEAHALGVRSSLGLANELGLSERVDLHMGTLSKAAGVAGGYIACGQYYAELMENKARSFIYSTAPPPGQCLAALRALELICSNEGEQLRKKLWTNIQLLESELGGSQKAASAIIPWHIGSSEEAMEMSQKLKTKGFLVPAVRYPTVPRNTARLRITVTARHNEQHIRSLISELNVTSK